MGLRFKPGNLLFAGCTIGRGRRRVSSKCYVVALLGLWLPSAGVAKDERRPVVEVHAEHLLPVPLLWAFDVRWYGPEKVLVAAGKSGVFELTVKEPVRPVAFVPGSDAGGPWISFHLGISESHWVVAAKVFSYYWGEPGDTKLETVAFDSIVDIDLHRDRVVLLGGRRNQEGVWAADGAMAWFGGVETKAEALKPILFSRSGPGAKPMADCISLALGGVRFLADGSFVVVPGAEPGVFWYSAEGQLVRTWESRALGLEDECEPVLGATRKLAISPEARSRWLNERRFVDEILPLEEGPGLLIRQVEDGITRWSLTVLDKAGGVDRRGWLPVQSTGRWAHLQGDVLGNRVVFLVAEYGRDEPWATPRLIFGELVD